MGHSIAPYTPVGGEDGTVRVFDLRDGSAVASHRASDDTLNGFEFHPYLPFAASASGDWLTLTIPAC